MAVVVAAAPLSACGGSSKSKGSSTASVQACLQAAGYGVTPVPAADVTGGGAESRGPGQTGELLVGEHGARPHVGADDAAAVIAFWDSRAHAAGSPNARDRSITSHADTFGTTTVQPTLKLVELAVGSAKTPAERKARFYAELKKIEHCA
jgi:hypothetical protein